MATFPAPMGNNQPEAGRPQVRPPASPVVVPTPAIWSGTLLVREETTLPEGFAVVSKPLLPAWRMVCQPRPVELERALSQKGWHLFCLAGVTKASGIALNWERALKRALQKLCAKASGEGLNAVEVGQVKMRKLFGLRRVCVTAKLRHIQEGPYLLKTAEQMAWQLKHVKTAAPVARTDGQRLGRDYREYKYKPL